jgi:hypothetical protein
MDLWRRQKTDSQLLITAVTGDLDSPTRQLKSTRTLRPGRSSILAGLRFRHGPNGHILFAGLA